MSALLAAEDLHVAYGAVRAVDGVSLHVAEGEAVAVIGANGAGKTSLLMALAGVVSPRSGRVALAGRDATGWGPERKLRAGLAVVPERRQLFAGLSVRDNLLLGAYATPRRARDDGRLERVHELFPVLADRRDQVAGTLSGGEQQMLAIGRALMGAPRLLALDEPALGLAPIVVDRIIDALRALRGEMALLLVEQNARAAMLLADRVLVLERGRAVREGTPAHLAADEAIRAAYLGLGALHPPTTTAPTT